MGSLLSLRPSLKVKKGLLRIGDIKSAGTVFLFLLWVRPCLFFFFESLNCIHCIVLLNQFACGYDCIVEYCCP